MSKDYSLIIISFEKSADRADVVAVQKMKSGCAIQGMNWIALRFYARPRPWAPALAVLQLAFASFRQCWLEPRPHLVHARSYVPAAIALLLRKLTGVPFIFDMRALWPEELITARHLSRGSVLHRALIWLEQSCLKEASAVISLTHVAIDYLKVQYPRELSGQRIVVIPTCADLQRFTPLSTPSSSQLVIGCIGTVLSGWFLIDWLRAFFDAVARVDSTARFELISRDSPEAIFASLKPDSSWIDRLIIKSASPAEMPAIVQRHTASVMFYAGGSTSELGRSPTRMAEVLGCGLPVVTNPGVGDVEDVVRSNRIGVLAPGFSAAEMDVCVAELLELLKDSQLASRCRRTAEELFSLEAGTAAYRQLYADILA
ncbi:glycosyltransferase [Synechococcus sp. MIT S9508]|uniref:glycosyltransferase n=1 Tax=Synechococcus sp. MIT S9508 TaxID=1801629 RepID=UPI0039A43A5A